MALTRTARSRAPRGYTGEYPEDIWRVLRVAWDRGIAVSSDFARSHAAEVALAASLGWISSVSLEGDIGLRYWNITSEGVTAWDNRERLSRVP